MITGRINIIALKEKKKVFMGEIKLNEYLWYFCFTFVSLLERIKRSAEWIKHKLCLNLKSWIRMRVS